MMPRTGQAAIDAAEACVGENYMDEPGMCLAFVRGDCFGVASYYYSALDAWQGAPDKHPGDRNPPPAVPVWFDSSSPYEHVAFHCGGGRFISTYNDDVRVYSWAGMESAFGPYAGWAESINTVKIYDEEEEDMPTPQEIAAAVWQYQIVGSAPGGVGMAAEYLRDARNEHALTAPHVWEYQITGPEPGGVGMAAEWLRDARNAPELNAKVDAATVTTAAWPLALVLVLAVIVGFVTGALSESTENGLWVGGATLLGGLVGWAVTAARGGVAT